MEEFIVETKRGNLYRVDYNKSFFTHGTRFTLKPLHGTQKDLGEDEYQIISFRHEKNKDIFSRKLKLEHFLLGSIIRFIKIRDLKKINPDRVQAAIYNTDEIIKIFKRIK